jgi:peptidoglycan/LPS O-acetylase OafA/YrhL
VVISQHAGISGTNGDHGVTLFFVISGYLITRLLVQEHNREKRIDLRRFYGRRLARLAPALILVVLATWLWLALINEPLSSYWAGIVGSLTSTTDIMQAVAGNGGVGRYYQWSWSLGVEELFYLVWPVTLLVLLKWRSFVGSVAVLVTAIAGCWILRALLLANGVGHERFYFSPDTNADSLLLGTLLALLLIHFPHSRVMRIAGRFSGPIGLVAFVALVWPHSTGVLAQFDGGAFGQTALACAALVFAVAMAPTGWGSKILGWRPLVLIGKLSYGVYLWNLLTINIFQSIVHVRPFASWWGILWLAALIGLSYASWKFVETPLRKRLAPGVAHAAPQPHVADRETATATAS